jgi:hypothetical protein
MKSPDKTPQPPETGMNPDPFLQKTGTHTVWAPFFDYDEGNFVQWVKVGSAILEMDGAGRTSGRILRFGKVTGYESGYTCLLPKGQQPPDAPPAEVLEDARYEAEQRSQGFAPQQFWM